MLATSQAFSIPVPGHPRIHDLRHILSSYFHVWCWIQKIHLKIGLPVLPPCNFRSKTIVEYFKVLVLEILILFIFLLSASHIV